VRYFTLHSNSNIHLIFILRPLFNPFQLRSPMAFPHHYHMLLRLYHFIQYQQRVNNPNFQAILQPILPTLTWGLFLAHLHRCKAHKIFCHCKGKAAELNYLMSSIIEGSIYQCLMFGYSESYIQSSYKTYIISQTWYILLPKFQETNLPPY